MVARRPRLDAPRAGEVCGEHAADGALARLGAVKRAEVGGLEGERLALLREQRLDLGEPGSGARGEHELFRLVERHSGKGAQIDAVGRLHRPSEPALGARTRDLERHALGGRPLDDRPHLLGIARLHILQHGHA